MAETGLQGNFRSPIGARLEGIEAEYKRLQEERDQAIRERDEAREAWKPFLQEIEDLRARVLAVVPKDRRLPSAKTRGTRMITGRPGQPSEETVDGWVALYQGGESVNQIAQGAGVAFDTVKRYLVLRGIGVKAAPKRKAGPTCAECGVELGEGEVDVCNTCKEIDGRIAARRAEREAAA